MGWRRRGLMMRPHFNRYTDDAVDLCDVLSSFSMQSKVTLDELSRVMGLPGKPNGMSGAEVERHYQAGRLREPSSKGHVRATGRAGNLNAD
jgi:3'-5' exonuclease